MGLLLRPRAAPQGQVANGNESIAPGIGGSAVATATGPVDDSGLALDPNQTGADKPSFPVSLPGASSSDTLSTASPTVTPSNSASSSSSSSKSSSSTTTTIIIASVAAAAFLLIGAATLLLFCRSNKRSKRRQSGRGQWREIESHQSQPGFDSGMHYPPEAGKALPPSQAMFQSETKSLYSTRRSTDAPPSLHLEFNQEPLMTNNPFASSPSPSSPVPPVPAMPTLYNVQQPQHITVEHPVEPPSAGFSAPSEYTASYIRSVYSATGDAHSIADSHGTGRSRSNTLKRGPDRAKNHQELIALDNLIMALDLKEDTRSDGERQDLPDPSLFRAALGGGPAPSQHGY